MTAHIWAISRRRRLGVEHLVGMGAEEFARRFRVSYLDGSLVPPQELISQRAFREGGPLHHKVLLYPENGPERIVSVTAAAVRVYTAEPPDMVVSVMHDITESERLNNLRDQFFAAAAHGLKTPVAIIKSNVQMLLAGCATREPAVAIGQQCDCMDLMVQNLFVLARIRSNSLRLYPQEVELAPLVEKVTAAVAAAWTGYRVTSELRLRSSARIRADQERIALVLRNLLDEALRLSTPQEPVTVLLVQQGRDAGIGVRHRARAPAGGTLSGSAIYADLGINRLVTSTIIAAHGGELRHDAVGDAVTAWITLPVEEARA